jgi:D-beta-D-heptose 7-phosphate kinase/D-beta-D-heptose 1-phosphate adenosyltransferase
VRKLMERLLEILRNFPERKITVIGDIMLDKTIIGEVHRISPEAPIQIVNVKEEFYEPGGAANVATNVASLGGKVSLFGFAGKDNNANILLEILEEKDINYFLDETAITTLKIRVRSKNQQLLRIDYEESSPKTFNSDIRKVMRKEIENSDLILISDYAKGAITGDLMSFLKSLGKKVVIDPKPQNISFYPNFFLITPNEKEALEMSKQENIHSAGRYLQKVLDCNVLITHGEKGMMLFSDNEIEIPTTLREVYDVTGAGDTANAAICLSLASGASLEEAVLIANHAAGISVGKIGTYQVKLGELEKAISGEEKKLKTLDELVEVIRELKRKQKKIVWTNGCFDLFHAGHKYSLEQARKKGDVLIVGLDSDESVRKLKGPERPIYNQEQRAEILSGMGFVDYITIFSSGKAVEYLKKLEPHVYVKSGDYTIDTINQEERKVVESYGGEIYLPKGIISELSTTNTIKKIKNSIPKR